MYFAVWSPGLRPGRNAPLLFRLSAVSLLLKTIKLYVEENHPDHYIVHARKVRTKGGNVFFLVKLVSSDKQNFVVLKFDKDGVLVTS